MREQEREEFMGLFFGRVVAHETFETEEEPAPRQVERALPIGAASAFSRHIVDLSQASHGRAGGPRPDLDFEQKLSVLAHSVRSAISAQGDDHRAFKPRRSPRTPLSGFLKLPFFLIALPFKNLPGKGAEKPVTGRPVRPTVAAKPRQPVGMPTKILSGASTRAAVFTKRVSPDPVIKTMPRQATRWTFVPVHLRSLVTFVAIALLISLPLQALLTYGGLLRKATAIAAGVKDAATGLRDGGQSALAIDGSSQASFDRAAGAFAETRSRIDDLSVQLAALVTGNHGKLMSGGHVLAAGEAAAKAGSELSQGLDAVRASQDVVTAKLAAMAGALTKALPYLRTSAAELDQVTVNSLPKTAQVPFSRLRDETKAIIADLQRVSDDSGVLLDAIGANGTRRYLIVFENSNELRPTGGFIGSYGLMDLEDGAIKNIEIPAGGSYDLRAGFNRRIAAPQQLALVNPRWEFQDANWFADFPTSAQSLTWFYEKSGGPTVDGVIAVTSNVMQALLRQIGPIDLPDEGRTITADNFQLETQKAVELDYDRETNKPKQIISDMAPKVLQKLLAGGTPDLPALSAALGASLASKDIQVYFADPKAQAAAADFGWTGALQPIAGADFLSIVDTNIAGGKTDGVVSEDIRHEMHVGTDGAIVDTITISRTHHGKAGEMFTGIKNIDYLRAYVPQGSTLLSAEGFEAPGAGYFQAQDDTLQSPALLSAVEGRISTEPESGTRISQESGLTVFGNWMQVGPGETRTAKFSYRLPFRLQDLARKPSGRIDQVRAAIGAWTPTVPLRLVVRKQPGALNRTFSIRMSLPDDWKMRAHLPEEAQTLPNGLTFSGPLVKDLYVGMLLTHD